MDDPVILRFLPTVIAAFVCNTGGGNCGDGVGGIHGDDSSGGGGAAAAGASAEHLMEVLFAVYSVYPLSPTSQVHSLLHNLSAFLSVCLSLIITDSSNDQSRNQ